VRTIDLVHPQRVLKLALNIILLLNETPVALDWLPRSTGISEVNDEVQYCETTNVFLKVESIYPVATSRCAPCIGL
jgi:hypothetical protein